jgi:hypothetical protein
MNPIRAVRISTTSQSSPDLVAALDFAGTQLQLGLSASRALRVRESKGSRSVLDAFGAKKPNTLRPRKPADHAEAAPQMSANFAPGQRGDFHWNCDLAVAPGGEMVLCIPTTKRPTEAPKPGVLAIVYEHLKPTAPGRQKLAVYLMVDVQRAVQVA